MQCQRCGKNLENSTRCNFCGFENSEVGNVREMSQIEKNFFDGVTIDYDGATNSTKNYNSANFKFFSKLFEKFVRGLLNDSLIAKIIAGLIVIAFVGIFFMVALPAMFFMLALGIALIFYAKITKKI